MAGRIVAAFGDALLSGVMGTAKKVVPKGVKLRPQLEAGDLAKKQFVEQRIANIKALRKIDDRAEVFNLDKVSDKYSQFLNKPIRKLEDKIYPKEAGETYLQYGKDYWDENRNLIGHNRYRDPDLGIETHILRDNSTFLKDGQRSLKVRKISNREIERAKRIKWEEEQTMGPSGRSTLVHHKSPLGLIDRIAAGLVGTERRQFFEFVHQNDRWPSLVLGNQGINLIGLVGDARFHPIHVDVHRWLNMAGLNDKTIDFTGATLEQRYGFLDEVAPLLDQIDEYIYGQIMAGKYPNLRHTKGPLKGQKVYKGYQRPPEDV